MSAAVAGAAQAVSAGRLVQESLAFVYADGGDAWLDEHAPVSVGGPTSTALAAEANATELFAGDTVVLRFGVFIGPDSALTQADVEGARAGISPSLGRRNGYRPTVWLDDAATAVAAALGAPAGTYNVADDDPSTRAEIDAALAAAVGRDALRPAMRSRHVSSRWRARSASRVRGCEASGWTPRVRAGIDGWRLIAERLLAA